MVIGASELSPSVVEPGHGLQLNTDPRRTQSTCSIRQVLVYVILDDRTSTSSPLGDAVDTFLRREDAERFVEDVRRDDPDLAQHLRIEERELNAGDVN